MRLLATGRAVSILSAPPLRATQGDDEGVQVVARSALRSGTAVPAAEHPEEFVDELRWTVSRVYMNKFTLLIGSTSSSSIIIGSNFKCDHDLSKYTMGSSTNSAMSLMPVKTNT